MFRTACVLATAVALTSADCGTSDANLLKQKQLVCASFAEDCAEGAKADGDWPSQAVHVRDLIAAVADPATCLNTTFAAGTIAWLNEKQGVPSYTGGFMWTWDVFQKQYYDMPRLPGTRIESPDTLGRKCWAFAYLAQESAPVVVAATAAVAAAGQNLTVFSVNHASSIPTSFELCEEVKANCFVNATYDPSRNGTCALKVTEFRYLGFERENLKRAGIVRYPFTG